MNEIDALVPGFAAALERVPGTAHAYQRLGAALARSPLSVRNRAMIAVAVAHQVRCDYCAWVAMRAGERQGLSAEEMFFASAGTSLLPREAALVRIATRMVANGVLLKQVQCEPHEAAIVAEADMIEIAAYVAFCVLTCYVLQEIAPKAGTAATQPDREV